SASKSIWSAIRAEMPSNTPGATSSALSARRERNFDRRGSVMLGAPSAEIFFDDPPIHRRQRDEIGDRRAFVDAVHGLPDQAEFQHRAIILDEARIRGAAGGREFWLTSGDFGDGGRGEIGERAGFCNEDGGGRRLPVEGIMNAAGRGGAGAVLEQRFQRGLAVAVVVADVEA